MSQKTAPVPKGFHTVTPYLTVKGGQAAIEFYKAAFDAVEKSRFVAEDGVSIAHAELKIGNSVVFLNDELPEAGVLSPLSLGGSPFLMHLYVKDVDTVWQQALAAGGREVLALGDTYWGDRCGKLVDPYGHYWSIASKQEKLTPAQIEERAQAAIAPRSPFAEAAETI